MTSLSARAEQALIGALLADSQPTGTALQHLQAGDFGNSLHAALYTTITETRIAHPSTTGYLLAEMVADRIDTEGVEPEYLLDLRDRCTHPEHAPAYARMVTDASIRRELLRHADRITTTAAYTQDVAGNTHLNRLAAALARQAQINAALIAADDNPAPIPIPEPTPAAPTIDDDVDPARVMAEEELLADLLRHPDQATELTRFLHSDAFTTAQRAMIYEVTLNLAYNNEPLDPLTLSWAVQQLRATEQRYLDLDTPHLAEPDDTYIARLARTQPTRTAVIIGRDLLAEQIRTTLNGRLIALTPESRPTSTPTALDPRLRPPEPPTPGQNPSPRIDR